MNVCTNSTFGYLIAIFIAVALLAGVVIGITWTRRNP